MTRLESATMSKVKLVYDKRCPACSQYCEWVKSSAVQPEHVVLVDARAHSELMAKITQSGLDIDEGMVVEVAGELYYGAEAIHKLAELDGLLGWFGALNRVMFRHVRVARLLYPAMRWVRNGLLEVLGVRRINNLDILGKDKF